MNKYSFDGDSFFILKAAQDCVINGVNYVKGQPVTYFEHCKPVLYYADRAHKTGTSVNNLISYFETAPNTLTIQGISKQESISNLIFNKNYDTIYTEERVEEGTVDENGKIFLKCSDEVVIKNVFVYDNLGKMVKVFQLFQNILIGSNALEGNTYKIFYTIEYQKSPINSFNCVSAKIPYLYGSIITKGKINGIDGKMIVEFPKLSCITSPTLNFWGDEMFDTSLSFVCIDTEKTPVKISYSYE